MKKKLIFKIMILIFALVFLLQFLYIKKKNNIDLCFSIDNNFAPHLMVTLFSIFKNSNSHFNIYIIDNNISTLNKFKIRLLANLNVNNVYFFPVNMSKYSELPNHYKSCNYVKKITFARFDIPLLLPKNVHKVLYLDADLIAIKDIKDLYNIDISKYMAGMIKDSLSKKITKESKFKYNNYYNVGVMLINLDKWRENNVAQKLLDCAIINQKQMAFADQDIINLVLKNKIKTLNLEWNVQYLGSFSENFQDTYKKEDFAKALNSPGIIHYLGRSKPWYYTSKTDDKIYAIYFKYLNELARFKFLDTVLNKIFCQISYSLLSPNQA